MKEKTGWKTAAFLVAFLFLEHLSVPLKLEPLPSGAAIPEAHRAIADRADVRVVVEVPSTRYFQERFDGLPMYLSTVHWKRTLQGFTGYFPPAYNFIRWRVFHFPHPESVRFLEKIGADTIIVNPVGGRLPEWATDRRDSRRRRALLAGAVDLLGPFREGHLVVRLRAAPQIDFAAPERDASWVPLDSSRWRSESSRVNAAYARDGDPETVWTTKKSQIPTDFYRIELPDAAVVGRVSLLIPAPYEFPMNLAVRGETESGEWVGLDYDVERAYDRLFALLLYRPKEAALDLEVPPTRLRRLELRVDKDDPFAMPWTMSEVRLYTPPALGR